MSRSTHPARAAAGCPTPISASCRTVWERGAHWLGGGGGTGPHRSSPAAASPEAVVLMLLLLALVSDDDGDDEKYDDDDDDENDAAGDGANAFDASAGPGPGASRVRCMSPAAETK